jgi:arsenate reductase
MEKAMSAGELQRFVQRFGLEQLIDRESKRYEEMGLRHATASPSRWLERLIEEPLLLRMPLVRKLGQPQDLTVGYDETRWKSWVAAP